MKKISRAIRLLDIFYSTTFLIVFSPIIILALLIVLLEDGNSPIFIQKRVGKNEIEFDLYKIRSMSVKIKPKNQEEYFSTEVDDPRITKCGKILRKYSIDEFPQFFNVIKGDMSMIGPRPALIDQKQQFSENGWYKRHKVRPGISGLAQIESKQNETITMKEIENLDLKYVNEFSLKLYINLILRTFNVIFNNR